MADLNKLGLAHLMANDPAPTTSYDYEVNRGAGGNPLMQDISGVTPMGRYPMSDLPGNLTKATLFAMISRLLMDAPGPLKATAAIPAYYGIDSGLDAYRNYQQLQGSHPMQQRQSAWEHLMDAASRPTPQTGFDRSRFTKD